MQVFAPNAITEIYVHTLVGDIFDFRNVLICIV